MSKESKGAAAHHEDLWAYLKKGALQVAIIGSGNWGTAIARVVGQNARKSYLFRDTVNMWVYEEEYKGKKLTEVINSTHINQKYMPGVTLPDNVIAEPDLKKATTGAHILVFVLPHQFIRRTCNQLKGHVLPGAKAISLIKGFDYEKEKGQIHLMSEYISDILGVECSSLSGANVANDVAHEQFAETTIGYASLESARVFQQLFDTPYFRVNAVPDVKGVELCGSLKNIIAIGCGFADGLGLGTNTKAALIRLGLSEMKQFAAEFYDNVIQETFWDSCGVADLITTCFGGRNRRVAEAFIKTGKTWLVLEKELLNGQKLQGVLTATEVYEFLQTRGKTSNYALFTQVYRIATQGASPTSIIGIYQTNQARPVLTTVTPLSKL